MRQTRAKGKIQNMVYYTIMVIPNTQKSKYPLFMCHLLTLHKYMLYQQSDVLNLTA